MATKIDQNIIELFGQEDTTKVLATVDELGYPHAAAIPFLYTDEDGNLLYLELVESSPTQKNLVRSIWFGKKVTLSVSNKAGQSWQIKGQPIKTLITGPVFLHHYRAVRERLGDVDLSAVWVIEPEEVINENILVRHAEEALAHPAYRHLDRLAKA
jgi:hypothetical protein